MPLFRYEAISAGGKLHIGTHDADIVQQVEAWLVEKGMTPVHIDLAPEHGITPPGISRFIEDIKLAVTDRLGGVTIDDLILFCRQIGTMLSAGVAVLPALEIMTRQTSNPKLGKFLENISVEVEAGTSMSEAFSLFPRTFNKLFINIIRIGEETGTLNNSFDYLATLYENEKDVRERIKTATRYPKIVIIAIVGAVIFLMSFVVPKFVGLFSKSKAALPLATKILITLSDFFAHNLLLIATSAVLLSIGWAYAQQYQGVALARDRFILRLPVLGTLSTKIYMSRFCRVLAILGRSGIDIVNALRLAASALDNLVLYYIAEELQQDVEEGITINAAMARHPEFPPMVVQMVAVGEETGELDAMLDKVADYYEAETNYTIKNLSTLIEPILLLVMGLVVGLIALAIFSPMWDMMNVMRG